MAGWNLGHRMEDVVVSKGAVPGKNLFAGMASGYSLKNLAGFCVHHVGPISARVGTDGTTGLESIDSA